MHSDHHFMIGSSHLACEDYAASHGGFAALADGCSVVKNELGETVEAHTDVGARLLVRAAFHHQNHDDLRLTVHAADGYRRQMDLAPETLSATLVYLRADSDSVYSSMAGDGIVAGRTREGRWAIQTVTFPRRPFYPCYLLMSRAESRCCTANDGAMIVSDLDTSVVSNYDQPRVVAWPRKHYDLVVAASDGVLSFTKDCRPVTFTQEFAERLLDFRRMKGRFMVRHLAGVLRELAAEGIVNQDDVSMIALYDDQ